MAEETKDTYPPQTPVEEQTSHTSPFEELLNQRAPEANDSSLPSNIEQAPNVFGTPYEDITMFPGSQGYPDTCVIRCEEFVLKQFTGSDYDEAELVKECKDHGWYTPGDGTSPEDVGKLLELHGVAVNRYQNANIFNLTSELAQGHKVIIGVDSGELWNQHPVLEQLSDALHIGGADHAVVVSGIDTSDPQHTHVLVSDPGTGEAVASYPIDQFLDAWQDSNFFMVTTQEPAPRHLPEMFNFDYDAGHLEYVNGIPYDQFLELEDQPELWDEMLTSPPDKETLEHALFDEDAADRPVSEAYLVSPEEGHFATPAAGVAVGDTHKPEPEPDDHASHHSSDDPGLTDDTHFFD
jgi:hypothetical protein